MSSFGGSESSPTSQCASWRDRQDLQSIPKPGQRGLYKPSADVLKNIANALHISAETMYTQAGLLDETKESAENRHGVEHAIKLDPRLTVDQKEALIRIYRSFISTGG